MRQKTKKMNYTIYKYAIALVNSWRNGKKKIHQEKRDEENANINTNNGMNFMNEEIFSLNAQLCNTAFCRKENWGKKAETHILLQKKIVTPEKQELLSRVKEDIKKEKVYPEK